MSFRMQAIIAAAVSMAAVVGLPGCAGGPGLEQLAQSARPLPEATGESSATTATSLQTGTVKTSAAAAPRQDNASLSLARSLRDKGDKPRALVELERAQARSPKDRAIALEAGILALELGHLDKARRSLEAANDPAKPDWHTLAALGTVAATDGNQREAQTYFKRVLELKPNHQPTLNNLALSYALDGKLAEAESTLKRLTAGGQPPRQVQENLALVLALSGKHAEAEKIATGVLAKDKAKANIAYVRAMTQQGS
ncbi:MAG: tetratricopeptide repeat protein [Hyphomicrobiaceae bacterium]